MWLVSCVWLCEEVVGVVMSRYWQNAPWSILLLASMDVCL